MSTATVSVLAGRYRLLDTCGEGGMSVVWRAFDEVLEREVAVKLLKPEYADDDHLRSTIRREARAAARLSHPAIASVYDFGETPDGTSFVVMELVAGAPFSVRLHDGAVPWREAVRVCAEVAGAMAEAHMHGVVHRDIKPGNVMLSPTGAKVVDFGISAVVGEADGATSGRRGGGGSGGRGGLATMGTLGTLGTMGGTRGQIVGTPAYMAPERLTGGRADSATDVYSLGLMLYRALAGELPWPATSASQVLAAHAAGTPTLRVPDGVPDEIVAACQACVAKDPSSRPSMAELTLMLTGSIDEDILVPIAVPRDLAPTRTMELTLAPTQPHVPLRVRRRHLVLAGVAASVLLLGLVGAMNQVSNGAPPDPVASFGDAAVPEASVSPPVLPAKAGEKPRGADNRGPGNGADNGNSGQRRGGGNGGGRRG